MGRRQSGTFPKATIHRASGRARLRLGGREYWLGPAGSREADERYRTLVASWVASGGRSVDDSILAPPPAAAVVTVAPGKPVTVTTAPPPPAPAPLTIGGLLVAYLSFVKASRVPGEARRHAKWWNARQVANALESRAAIPVDRFGPKMLREVRDELAATPMATKRAGKTAFRTRRCVNRTVQEIRACWKWAAAEELIPVERFQALQCVAPLRAGDGSTARESIPRTGVPDGDMAAILPFLPPVVADVIRFCRLAACRPGEAFSMRLGDVSLVPEFGIHKYAPPRHKTSHHGKVREIAVGPEAWSIVSRWSAGKPATALVFARTDVFRARTSQTIPMRRRDESVEKMTDYFLRGCVHRACDAAGVPRFTPYQLRHSGLQAARDKFGPEVAQAVGGQGLKVVEIYAKASFAKAAEFARAHG